MRHYVIEAHDNDWFTPRGMVLAWGAEKHLSDRALFALVRIMANIAPIERQFTEQEFVSLLGSKDVGISLKELSAKGFIEIDYFDSGDRIVIRATKPARHRRANQPLLEIATYFGLIEQPVLTTPYVTKPNYIYFIKSHKHGLIKIGISYRPQDRCTSLSKHLDDTLSILCTINGKPSIEQELHRRFKNFQGRHPNDPTQREWFHPVRPIIDYIVEHHGRADLDID